MNARQTRLMRSIHSVTATLGDPRFHVPTIRPLRTQLERVVKSIDDQITTQLTAERQLGADGLTVSRLKRDLRRKHLFPIARRGKLLLKGYPGIEESLRIPHARADVKTHVAATKRMIKALRPHARAFLGAGFRKTFLTDCEQAARAMAERNANPDTARNRRSVATRSIPDGLREAREIIESIDALVVAELSHDRPLLAMWRGAKRVPAKQGRPRNRKPPRGPDPPERERGPDKSPD